MSVVVSEYLLHQTSIVQTLERLSQGLPRRSRPLRLLPVLQHLLRSLLGVRVVLRSEALQSGVGHLQLDAQVLPVHRDASRNLREIGVRDEFRSARWGRASSRGGDCVGCGRRVRV